MRLTGAAILVVTAYAGGTPAWAVPRQASFAVTATVPSSCSLGSQAGPFTLSTVIPANGKLDPNLANATWTLSGLQCSSASRLTLKATSLRLRPPRASLSSSQSQAINFTATASGWTSTPATVTTAETTALGTTNVYTGTAQVQSGARTGFIVIRVSNFITATDKGTSANSAKPVDGSYSATISVLLAPNS